MKLDKTFPVRMSLATVAAILAIGGVALGMQGPSDGRGPSGSALSDSATPTDEPTTVSGNRSMDDDGTPDQGPGCCESNDDRDEADNSGPSANSGPGNAGDGDDDRDDENDDDEDEDDDDDSGSGSDDD